MRLPVRLSPVHYLFNSLNTLTGALEITRLRFFYRYYHNRTLLNSIFLGNYWHRIGLDRSKTCFFLREVIKKKKLVFGWEKRPLKWWKWNTQESHLLWKILIWDLSYALSVIKLGIYTKRSTTRIRNYKTNKR